MGIIIRQGFYNSLITYIGALIGAVSTIFILPYCFSPETIGLLRLLTEVSFIFAYISILGIAGSINKYYPIFKNKDSNDNNFFWWSLLIPLVGYVLLLFFVSLNKDWVISIFSDHALFSEYFIFGVILTFFNIILIVFEAHFVTRYKIETPKFLKEIFLRLALIFATFLFFKEFITLYQFFVIYVLAHLIAVLIAGYSFGKIQSYAIKKASPDIFSKGFVREAMKFMTFIFLSNLCYYTINRIDIFMISSLTNLSNTGLYSIGLFLAIIIEIPSRSLLQVLSINISEDIKNNNIAKLKDTYKRVTHNQILIAGFLFFLLWFNIDAIFDIMPNGDLYASSKYVVLFIGLSKLVDAITGVNFYILNYSKYYIMSLIFLLFLAASAISMNLFLIPKYGLVGAALTSFVSLSLYNILVIIYIKSKFKMLPFTKANLKALIFLIVIFCVLVLIPSTDIPVLDVVLRSTILFLLFLLGIIKLRLSEDLFSIYLNLQSRFRK